MMTPYVEGVEPVDSFQLAYKRGARGAIAEAVEESEALPEEWGYPGEAVARHAEGVQPPVRGAGPRAGPAGSTPSRSSIRRNT